jgi:uncharacterized Zn finger protein
MNDYCKCKSCGPTLHWQKSHPDAKKIAENVYLLDNEIVAHSCPTIQPQWFKKMILRENDEGPLYWCEECGYVLEKGVSMAVRLYEVPIARSRHG